MDIRYINKEDDLLEISSIYEKSWKYAYKGIIPRDYLDSIPEGRWVNGLGREGLYSLVLTENGHIIGTASICASRWKKFDGFGEIVSIYLLPEHIGRGYGKALFERCISELKKRGFERSLLWVLEENTRARAFYERNGFVCSDEYMDDTIGGKALREVMYINIIT